MPTQYSSNTGKSVRFKITLFPLTGKPIQYAEVTWWCTGGGTIEFRLASGRTVRSNLSYAIEDRE